MTYNLAYVVAGFLFVSSAAADVVEQVEYSAAPGDETIDSGVMLISQNGTLKHREMFEVIRRADGGRTVVSTMKEVNGNFNVQGRWDYDAAERATSATGWGKHGDRKFKVRLEPGEPKATILVTYDSGEQRFHEGDCSNDCLPDLMPGALAQFTMTRRYDEAKGGEQDFPWMGFMLTQDIHSFDLAISFAYVGESDVRRDDGSILSIRQFVFGEQGTLDAGGEGLELTSSANNLWVDEAHRPIKYRVGSYTGLRAGFEDIDAELGVAKDIEPELVLAPE